MRAPRPAAARPPQDPVPVAQRRRGRRIALTILALCAAPIILGTLAFYFFPPHGRVNYGRLIPPRPFALPARLDSGAPLGPAALDGKWWLVTIDDGPCAAACENKLLLTRQLRLAQGKDQDRVARLLIVRGAAGELHLPPALAENLRTAAQSDPAAGFPDSADPLGQIYVVDPLGNLMMSFPAGGDARRMLRDIERLLRINTWERIPRSGVSP